MKKLMLLLAFVFAACGLFAKTTVIYHTSDTHGFYYPKNGVGGFAALKAVLNKEKNPYLLLDSGDFANGTIEAKESKGLKSVELMNAVGYYASTLGNHEFDFGDNAVEPMIRNAKFEILAANMVERSSGLLPPSVKPYQLFDIDGVRIAVIGLAHHEPSQKYKYKKDFKVIKKLLPEVEKLNPDVVVIILHNSMADKKHGVTGAKAGKEIAKITKRFGGRVHVMFGGHAHNIFDNRRSNGVLFVESGDALKNVTRVLVETDDQTGQFISARSELIPLIVAQTGEDEAVKKLAESLRSPGMDEKIGEAASLLSKEATLPNHVDAPLNNWVADVCRAHAGTEIFIHNNGAVRKSLDAGPITKRDLVEMTPFDNNFTKVKVTGKFLKFLAKNSLLPRNLYTYSGMVITFTDDKGKVSNLTMTVDGKPVEDHAEYIIATNSYIAGGGSEGWPFHKIDPADKQDLPGKTIREVIEDAARAQSPLVPVTTGRMIKF